MTITYNLWIMCAALTIAAVFGQMPDDEPGVTCTLPFEYLRSRDDCSRWYRCSYYYPLEMASCGNEMIFSLAMLTCVPRNHAGDDCEADRPQKPETLEEKCDKGATILIHPTRCGQFYNCSKTEVKSVGWEKYLDECPYMQLFDVNTLKCQDFQSVSCDDRQEPKAPCDYLDYACPSYMMFCRRCHAIYPSCIGMADGFHSWPGYEDSPRYMKCFSERTIGTGKCEIVDGIQLVFSPEDSLCVQNDETNSLKSGF